MARSSLSRRLPVLLLLPCCRLRGREAQWLARQLTHRPMSSGDTPSPSPCLTHCLDCRKQPVTLQVFLSNLPARFLSCTYRHTRRTLSNAGCWSPVTRSLQPCSRR